MSLIPANDLSASLTDKVCEYVLDLLSGWLDKRYIFHNQRYVAQTVHAVGIIAKAEELSIQDRWALEVAAWFQFTGLVKTQDTFRQSSIEFARKFLSNQNLSNHSIEQISGLIERSSSPANAETLADLVLQDANWYFLSAANFKEMLDRRKEEMINFDGQNCREKWADFLDYCFVQHQYQTHYGQEFLQALRRVNFTNLKATDPRYVPIKKIKVIQSAR